MHQDGPSVSAKTPGRAVAYPLDVITLASHTTADKRRTSPLPGHHHDHTAASRCSSRKLALNTLLTLREQVIAPILAGVRSPRMGRKPITWTSVDRDYEKIRIDMQTLFQDLGIRAAG